MADMKKLGEGNTQRVLFKLCQNEFDQARPTDEAEGIQLSNIEAGVEMNKTKSLMINDNHANYQMVRVGMKEGIKQTRLNLKMTELNLK